MSTHILLRSGESWGRTLKVAGRILCETRKSDLRFLLLKLVQDLPVGDITHLIVLLDNKTLLVAHSTLVFRHQGITSEIRLTHVTVDTTPSIRTLAILALPGFSVSPVRQ